LFLFAKGEKINKQVDKSRNEKERNIWETFCHLYYFEKFSLFSNT